MTSNDGPGQHPWLQHALRRVPWRQQTQTTAIAVLVLIVAIIIGALYLAQAMTSATTGRQLEDMQAQRNRIQQENEQIRAEIAAYRSVPRLIERARELGFVFIDRSQIEYLLVESYTPDRPETVAPLREEPELIPAYDETFGGWLELQWNALVSQFEAWTGSDAAAE